MRVVDGLTFHSMPSGTVFSRYRPCYAESIGVKGDSCADDHFWFTDLAYPSTDGVGADNFELAARLESGCDSGPIFIAPIRSSVEQNEQFLIFNRTEVETLISKLQLALKDGYTANRHSAESLLYLSCSRTRTVANRFEN